jgi:hypothetical protein
MIRPREGLKRFSQAVPTAFMIRPREGLKRFSQAVPTARCGNETHDFANTTEEEKRDTIANSKHKPISFLFQLLDFQQMERPIQTSTKNMCLLTTDHHRR